MTSIVLNSETGRTTLTRDEVIWGYRLILGREPESEEVIKGKLDSLSDLESLRATLLSSEEFLSGTNFSNFTGTVFHGYWTRSGNVQYKVTDSELIKLTERIRQQWIKLGEEDPYWSVLTDERFRSEKLDSEEIDIFRRTGADSAKLLDIITKKGELPQPRGVCLELGCGVGRITRHLADRFDKVIAVDISPGNLFHCRQYMINDHVFNVDIVLTSSVNDFRALPEFDYFYSIIVLQHNPPPVQYEILKILFGKIKRGGGCLFQVIADMPGYQFNVTSYLESREPVMEAHSLPMPAILELMREFGLQVGVISMDPWVNFYGSYTFAAHKP